MLDSTPRTKKGHTKENCTMDKNEISSPIQSLRRSTSPFVVFQRKESRERESVEDACLTRQDGSRDTPPETLSQDTQHIFRKKIHKS